MIDSGPGYFSLRDRDLRAEGLLVAEGRLLVERALVAKLDPLAVYASSEAYSDAERLVGGRVPVEVLDAAVLGARGLCLPSRAHRYIRPTVNFPS